MTTPNLGLTLSNPASPDYMHGDGWPAALDENLNLIDAFAGTVGGGGPALQSAKVTLTSAQLLAIATTPVQLVAAPGANKVIKVIGASAHYKFGSTPYNIDGTNYLAAFYAGMPPNGSTPIVIPFAVGNSNTGLTGFFDQSADQSVQDCISYAAALAWTDTPANAPSADLVNEALMLGPCEGPSGAPQGRMVTASVGSSGGSGYAVNDTGNGPDGTSVYVVDTVSGGAVTAFHLTNQGSGDVVASDQPTTPLTGGGDGTFLMDVNSVQAIDGGDGTLEVRIYYLVEDYS